MKLVGIVLTAALLLGTAACHSTRVQIPTAPIGPNGEFPALHAPSLARVRSAVDAVPSRPDPRADPCRDGRRDAHGG